MLALLCLCRLLATWEENVLLRLALGMGITYWMEGLGFSTFRVFICINIFVLQTKVTLALGDYAVSSQDISTPMFARLAY